MLSELGNLSVLTSIILGCFLIFFSIKELKDNNIYPSSKIKNIAILQLLFTNLSFLILVKIICVYL